VTATKLVEKVEMLVPFEESQKNTHAQGGTPEDHAEDDDDEGRWSVSGLPSSVIIEHKRTN